LDSPISKQFPHHYYFREMNWPSMEPKLID
jgi:hypothetical protein